MPLKFGLVGFGKIAHDEHLPAIAVLKNAELVAVASRNTSAPGFASYQGLEGMLAGAPDIDAVILCQPPHARFHTAREALLAGKHVFLEKPPGASLSEVQTLIELARDRHLTLFASWHSRFASCVAKAKAWISQHPPKNITITWKEDVRKWHPGQEWIWQPGGFGVFDPGINALSILTEIAGERIRLVDAELETPANRGTPIAARLTMATASGVPIHAEFDWRQIGPQSWDVIVETQSSTMRLCDGGNALTIGDIDMEATARDEYPAMYRHFAKLISSGRSDADPAPLELVADAFLRGKNRTTDAFHD